MREGWALDNDLHHPAWIYKDGAAWVRHFMATNVKPEHWQAYRMTEKKRPGRAPWGHQNARIGVEGVGFQTLESAMDAVESLLNDEKHI